MLTIGSVYHVSFCITSTSH